MEKSSMKNASNRFGKYKIANTESNRVKEGSRHGSRGSGKMGIF